LNELAHQLIQLLLYFSRISRVGFHESLEISNGILNLSKSLASHGTSIQSLHILIIKVLQHIVSIFEGLLLISKLVIRE
jgi:hypothetical protein